MANYKVKKKKIRAEKREKEELRKFFMWVGIVLAVLLFLSYLWYRNM